MIEYLPLTLEFRTQGKRWTALCDELGTATFGRSLFEANNRIKEAILLHLDTLDDVGELNRFLNGSDTRLHY